MKRVLLAVFVLLLLGRPYSAYAQTAAGCINQPNLLCALSGSEDAAGTYRFTQASPFIFEGATDDAIETTLSIGDPVTIDRTVFIPGDGNSATAKSQDCSPGSHLDSFDPATGNFACTADTGATAWDAIGDPSGAGDVAMGTFAQTLTYGVLTGSTIGFRILDGNSTTTGALFNVSTGATSTAPPVRFTAQGTTNGAQMSTAGVFARVGTGSIVADEVTCGSAGCVAGTDISDSFITWDQSCTASPCTLGAAPRTADTAIVTHRTMTLRRVTSCGGINEYTLSGTTLTFCDASQGLGSGADAARVVFES